MNPQMNFPAAWTSHSLAALCLRFWVVLSPSFCLSLPISHTLSFSSSSLRPTQPSFCPHYFLWLHPLLLRPQPFLVLVVPVAGLVTLGSFPLLCFYRSYNRDGVLLAYLFFFSCCTMWHVEYYSPTKDWIHAPCSGNTVLTTGLPEKSPFPLLE